MTVPESWRVGTSTVQLVEDGGRGLAPQSDAHGDVDFLALCEDILENTLANIMKESDVGDFDFTARSRIKMAGRM